MSMFTEHVLAWLGCAATYVIGRNRLRRNLFWVGLDTAKQMGCRDTSSGPKMGLIMIWLAMAAFPSMSNDFQRHPDCEKKFALPVTPKTRLLRVPGFSNFHARDIGIDVEPAVSGRLPISQTYGDPSQNLWQTTGKGTAHISLILSIRSSL